MAFVSRHGAVRLGKQSKQAKEKRRGGEYIGTRATFCSSQWAQPLGEKVKSGLTLNPSTKLKVVFEQAEQIESDFRLQYSGCGMFEPK